jgi:hypothetical protein
VGTIDLDVGVKETTQVLCHVISQYSHAHGGTGIERPAVWCIAVVSLAKFSPEPFTRVGVAKWYQDMWDESETHQ